MLEELGYNLKEKNLGVLISRAILKKKSVVHPFETLRLLKQTVPFYASPQQTCIRTRFSFCQHRTYRYRSHSPTIE